MKVSGQILKGVFKFANEDLVKKLIEKLEACQVPRRKNWLSPMWSDYPLANEVFDDLDMIKILPIIEAIKGNRKPIVKLEEFKLLTKVYTMDPDFNFGFSVDGIRFSFDLNEIPTNLCLLREPTEPGGILPNAWDSWMRDSLEDILSELDNQRWKDAGVKQPIKVSGLISKGEFKFKAWSLEDLRFKLSVEAGIAPMGRDKFFQKYPYIKDMISRSSMFKMIPLIELIKNPEEEPFCAIEAWNWDLSEAMYFGFKVNEYRFTLCPYYNRQIVEWLCGTRILPGGILPDAWDEFMFKNIKQFIIDDPLYKDASIKKAVTRNPEVTYDYKGIFELGLAGSMALHEALQSPTWPTDLTLECWDKDTWNDEKEVEPNYYYGFDIDGNKFYIVKDWDIEEMQYLQRRGELWKVLRKTFKDELLLTKDWNLFVDEDRLNEIDT